jgi:hypothetical protein
MNDLHECPFWDEILVYAERESALRAAIQGAFSPEYIRDRKADRDEAKAAIDAAWNRRGWVSVEERLPGPDEWVLCAYYHARLKDWVMFVGENAFEGGEHWHARHSEWITRAVTHYMPLPAEPGGDE